MAIPFCAGREPSSGSINWVDASWLSKKTEKMYATTWCGLAQDRLTHRGVRTLHLDLTNYEIEPIRLIMHRLGLNDGSLHLQSWRQAAIELPDRSEYATLLVLLSACLIHSRRNCRHSPECQSGRQQAAQSDRLRERRHRKLHLKLPNVGQAICDGANVIPLSAKQNSSRELLESKAIDGLQIV